MPDLISCPQCDKRLRVPDRLLGQTVKCPSCGTSFTAHGGAAEHPPVEDDRAGKPARQRTDEEGFAEQPRRSRIDRDAEDAGDRPRRSRDDDEEGYEDDRPRRSRRDDDEDEYEDDRRGRRRRRRREAEAAVNAPAIALIVVGILGLVMGVLNVLATLSGFGADPQMQNQPGFMMGRYLGAFVSLIWGIVVTLGGFKMKSLQSRGSAMTAAFFAMAPCNPCCLVGLPVGIWALVALSKPEVKEAFR